MLILAKDLSDFKVSAPKKLRKGDQKMKKKIHLYFQMKVNNATIQMAVVFLTHFFTFWTGSASKNTTTIFSTKK